MSLIPKRHTEGITTMNTSTTTKPAVTAIPALAKAARVHSYGGPEGNMESSDFKEHHIDRAVLGNVRAAFPYRTSLIA
jgi:hypothetical protein